MTGAFLRLAAESEVAGLRIAGTETLTDAEQVALAPVRDAIGVPLSDERLLRWLMAWHTVFGHVSLELFGHMHRGVLDYDAHFAQVVDQLATDLGL